MKKYYEAYEQRYKTIHEKGFGWFADMPTPIVRDVIDRYKINKSVKMLEIGCGEGRDAIPLLRQGFDLYATDVSDEAISYCRKLVPEYSECFGVLDCLNCTDKERYGFIYAVAVVHMLLLDCDRAGFYRFIKEHLTDDGVALICSMGDGISEKQTDIKDAFTLQERDHPTGKIKVAGTSFRMVSDSDFEKEITDNGLKIIEKGLTDGKPDYFKLMYAVAGKSDLLK